MVGAEGAGEGGEARREPTRGGGGEARANSLPRVRAEAGCRENPGMECGGERGDGIKPKPSPRRNGPLPFPALLCFWRVLDAAHPIAARRGSGRLAAGRTAPFPQSAGDWLARGAGWGGRAPVLGPRAPRPPEAGVLILVRSWSERSLFSLNFPQTKPTASPTLSPFNFTADEWSLPIYFNETSFQLKTNGKS